MTWGNCSAMIFAAGLGTRMRPLTENMPKPLVEIAGKSFLARAIEQLQKSGVTQDKMVVNAFHFKEQIEEFLEDYPGIKCSVETERLETGGGAKHALDLLQSPYFFTVNGDSVWLSDDLLAPLKNAWDPESMDALLMLIKREELHGFDGPGDFFMESDGRIKRRGDEPYAMFTYVGCQIIKSSVFEDTPEVFSLNLVWDRLIARKRLFGVIFAGECFHVSSVRDLEEFEAEIAIREKTSTVKGKAIGRSL